jgi:ERCC4-type nuclease
MFSLIVDNRERALFSHIDKEIKIFNYEKMQLNTGDYLIMFNKTIKACIERKTYTDFAASFRDGRYRSELENMKKMRNETNCQLFFIIEGNAFPSPTSKFSRVPYPCILGAINKLMLRDNIFIIQTKNEEHTAKKLNEL